MNCLNPHGRRDHRFESYSRHGCLCVCVRLFYVCVVLCRYRSCNELITCPRSPTHCLRLRNWSDTGSFMDASCSSGSQTEFIIHLLFMCRVNSYKPITDTAQCWYKLHYGHTNTYIESKTNYRQALEEKHINARKQTNIQTNKDEG
jgi:hypothetical protein